MNSAVKYSKLYNCYYHYSVYSIKHVDNYLLQAVLKYKNYYNNKKSVFLVEYVRIHF